ncbi:MAG: glucans biosynthesis glucosyltransferase MdoH [Desulfobacterales bacterium]|jgi:membrane glycosyltransferase
MNRKPIKKFWEKEAVRRRILLTVLILSTTAVASGFMANVLPHMGRTGLEIALVIFFAMLFAWISIGFWTSLVGFLILMRRYNRFTINWPSSKDDDIQASVRTAILMPVYNESVKRVFAGLRATYASLASSGQLARFDFFVLSDSTNPDRWVEEEAAWAELCREVDGFGKIYYRHRRPNIKRKSGNIADFCRRWGRSYRYMVVFDADSVMSGSTLARLLLLMEKNPDVGILQTAPMAVGRDTLIARVQQFANRVYGPMFAAGLHYWQLGDAQYWGHNAIIRIEPFMKHCALPQLPGKPPLGGHILSHDFVEAALMRRAGWEVWLAYELNGSYEEAPPTLLDGLTRDRRWCQGNMQHLRLLLTRGIFPAHRALFLNGAMSYISAILWFMFLNLSTVEALAQAILEPKYFPAQRTLFPHWPVWNPGWALTLLASTGLILFLPKLLSYVFILFKQRQVKSYGGFTRFTLSIGAEVIFSTFFAPIRMLFHSKFVFLILLGQKVGWHAQPREDRGTTWGEAFRFHYGGMLLALIWGAIVFTINRSFFWWLTPILIPLVLSAPLSVWSGRASLGRGFRSCGLFLIPEEIAPPPELTSLKAYLSKPDSSKPSLGIAKSAGFVRAVVDPKVNRLHLAIQRQQRRVAPKIAARRRQLVQKAASGGPDELSDSEKKELLIDPASLSRLHEQVWESPVEIFSGRWRISAP